MSPEFHIIFGVGCILFSIWITVRMVVLSVYGIRTTATVTHVETKWRWYPGTMPYKRHTPVLKFRVGKKMKRVKPGSISMSGTRERGKTFEIAYCKSDPSSLIILKDRVGDSILAIVLFAIGCWLLYRFFS